jgi:hypothetical protein
MDSFPPFWRVFEIVFEYIDLKNMVRWCILDIVKMRKMCIEVIWDAMDTTLLDTLFK